LPIDAAKAVAGAGEHVGGEAKIQLKDDQNSRRDEAGILRKSSASEHPSMTMPAAEQMRCYEHEFGHRAMFGAEHGATP